jgi:hypothetical protein
VISQIVHVNATLEIPYLLSQIVYVNVVTLEAISQIVYVNATQDILL